MFFFHKDRVPKSQDKPVNTVKLFLGDYYRDYGEQYSGGKRLLCVMPYYEDGDISFGNLMRSFGTELLSSFPFVLEQLLGDQFQRGRGRGIFRKPHMERANLLQEPYISEYQSQGGQVYCREKGRLDRSVGVRWPQAAPSDSRGRPCDSLVLRLWNEQNAPRMDRWKTGALGGRSI